MIRFPSVAAGVAWFALAGAALDTSALAQTPPGEIKGQDVLGDTSKSATGGFVQAPIPREESAGKDAPNPGGTSTRENASRPVPGADTPPTPGDDPQGPLDHRAPGPSGQNPASPSK